MMLRNVFALVDSEVFVLAKGCSNEADGQMLIANSGVAAARATTELQVKLNFWGRLPWRLATIAHFDPTIARAGAAACIEVWNNMHPDARSIAHPMTRRFCEAGWLGLRSSEGDPSVREDLDKFICGYDIHDLSLSFQKWVSALRILRVAERTCHT